MHIKTITTTAAALLAAGLMTGCHHPSEPRLSSSAYGYGPIRGSEMPPPETTPPNALALQPGGATAPSYVYGTPNITANPPVAGAGAHLVYPADDVRWMQGPLALPPGANMAILEGQPGGTALFTMRLLLPDGYRIPPHLTQGVTRLTVLDGVLKLGEGDTFNPAAMQTLPPGSYAVLGPETAHSMQAVGPTTIQITAMGPWNIHYVNPQDDPRNQ